MGSKSIRSLEHHLKKMKLPSFPGEYGKLVAQYAAENMDHPEDLLQLAELEQIDFSSAWWSGGSAPPASR